MCSLFFFHHTATTEIYTLSLHDALPIWRGQEPGHAGHAAEGAHQRGGGGGQAPSGTRARRAGGRRFRDRERHRGLGAEAQDRKSTRLNSSHGYISYAVFCLKKKKKKQ